MRFFTSSTLFQGIRPFDRHLVPTDVLAGITLAALAIPEVMGYTSIAGTPVVTGLYTIALPLAVFAVVGSSRHLVVAADSATAAILASSLSLLATPQSADYVALASLAALMTAGWLILARVVGLGFLADFLSRSVLVGFLTGVGIQVALGQVAGILGLSVERGGTVIQDLPTLVHLSETNLPTLFVSVSVLTLIVVLRRITRRLPGALLGVAGWIVAAYFFNLSTLGVTLLGRVPGGLPPLGVPAVNVFASVPPLVTTTFAMFVVVLTQSAATARAYAQRYEERSDENSDLVGLSLANVAAGLSGTFVVNGSPTKTQMVDDAGGRTQLSQLVCAAVVVLILLFLTAPLAFMPRAVLSAIVFLIGVELIDVAGMRRILYARPIEFWVALFTTTVVVLVGVEQAILVAMGVSLISHTRRGYNPHNSVLVTTPDGFWHSSPVSADGQAMPGLVIYRFTHSLYYANAQRFQDEALELTRPSGVPTRWLCADCVAIDDVDFSAGAMLAQVAGMLRRRSVRLVFADVSDHVRGQLDRSGVTDIVGGNAYFPDLAQVAATFKGETR